MEELTSKHFHSKNTTNVVTLSLSYPLVDSQQLPGGSGSLQMSWETCYSSPAFPWLSLQLDFPVAWLCSLPPFAFLCQHHCLPFFWISSGHLFRAHLSTKEDLIQKSLTYSHMQRCFFQIWSHPQAWGYMNLFILGSVCYNEIPEAG